ncbi:MAG: dienelactone hydrolase family protein [Actinomycetota bacterium]
MGEMIELGDNARGYLAVPDGGSGPGVLVIQEWWGLNPQMRGTADHLAENGFVALAPDLYRGELAGHDEMDKAGHLMSSLPAERAAADMSLAVDALRAHASTTGESIGAVGFCMGGMLTMMVAALRGDAISAAVPFYGYPTGDEPDWSGLTAVVRGHFCEEDDFFPSAGARDLEARLQDLGKDVQITFHDAGHAFMNETDPFGIHDAELSAQLWPEIIEFLHGELA